MKMLAMRRESDQFYGNSTTTSANSGTHNSNSNNSNLIHSSNNNGNSAIGSNNANINSSVFGVAGSSYNTAFQPG